MKMSQVTKESEIELAYYVWDIIIWNRVVLDTHIVGKIRLPQKFLRQDYSNSNLTLTYWASLISDSSFVWDIYILENSNLGPYKDCDWYWQIDLRHLHLLKIKLPQCLWSWNDPQFSSSLRSTYLRNIQGEFWLNWRSFQDHKHWDNSILMKYNHLKSICQCIMLLI